MSYPKKPLSIGIAIAIVAAIAIPTLIPVSETTYEFDGVNLRLRECMRSRSWLFDFVLSEECSEPRDHPTAIGLRALGVLPPISEKDGEWLLIRGRKAGARGWIGEGRTYLRALGATTFGTPVLQPAEEDLSENIWIKWAVSDPVGAKRFSREAQAVAMKGTGVGGHYLWAAKEYLEQHKGPINAAELEGHTRRETPE